MIFVKNMFKIGLCLDIYEPVSFRFGILIVTTEFYILIPIIMILEFDQGHDVARSWNLCHQSVGKWYEVAQTFAVVDCVKEMTLNKFCKYGEYGLFELFVF